MSQFDPELEVELELDPAEYTKIPYVIYDTLEEKLAALLRGETLYLKGFERKSGGSVLIRLERKKFELIQISHDLSESEVNPRYWVTYNVGLNDLSLFTAIKFEEGLPAYKHKYQINDTVLYVSRDGNIRDSAIVEEVYVSIVDPDQYAYKLSRDDGLYSEEDLIQDKFM
ncbi:virion structural protein [Bacillus phage Shbh1]|uniref:Uncharacterized protein n=1 Tax=Bacillus phage Shbh1 TaxID=1796992 RepID=A0A142F127_9CAUD|nr:virion structural protein [Bacillus phage Shbh1]AMQ66484.1 hypothetical protein [Bacillus phage Shbh1]